MTATNINILGRQGWESDVNDRAILASVVQVNVCATFKLQGKDCAGVVISTIYFDVPKFKEPKYTVESEFIQNGFGQKTKKYARVKREYSFETLTDDSTVEAVYQLYAADKMYASFVGVSGDFEVAEPTIEQNGRVDDIQKLTIRFKDATTDDIGAGGCCFSSIYADAPYTSTCPPVGSAGIFTDDAEAAANSVAVGGIYQVDTDNPYGLPFGTLKFRTS